MTKGPLSITNMFKNAGLIAVLVLMLLMGAVSAYAANGVGVDGKPCSVGSSNSFQSTVTTGTLPTTSGDIIIYDECVEEVFQGAVTMSWKTNVPAVGRVVYGSESVGQVVTPFKYEGYQNGTPAVHAPITTHHSVSVHGVNTSEVQYYRPVSKSENKVAYGREVAYSRAYSGTVVSGGSTSYSSQVSGSTVVAVGQTIPLHTSSCFYLRDTLRQGSYNDTSEVVKLQQFLNSYEGESLPLTGVFDDETFKAVSRFQLKYSGDVLGPWGYTEPTGHVYILTKKKINELYCGHLFPLTHAELQEIGDYNAKRSLSNTKPTKAPVVASIPVVPAPVVVEQIKPIIPTIGGATTTVATTTVATTTPVLVNKPEPSKPIIPTITPTVDDLARGSSTSFASLIFQVPGNTSELLRCALNFAFILIIVYIVSNILAETKNPNVSRRSIRLRKLVLYAIGCALAIPLAVWRDVHCLTLPLITLSAILVIAAVAYASTHHKENKIDFSILPKNPDQN